MAEIDKVVTNCLGGGCIWARKSDLALFELFSDLVKFEGVARHSLHPLFHPALSQLHDVGLNLEMWLQSCVEKDIKWP